MKAISGIPEVVILIFQHCDGFQDAIALASTCRTLASIWRAHFGTIIWPLAQAEIPGFSQALMAARATKLVCDAFEANTFPPDPFPLQELTGIFRKPDLEDLKRVFGLRHFVRCVEQMYRHWDHDGNKLPSRSLHEWDDPHDWEAMCNRFHIAMYRVLYVGAVLSRSYLEPLLLAPPDLLRRISSYSLDDGWPSEDLVKKHFSQFPIYNFEASDDKWELVFGDLARFLMDDIKTTATPTPYEVQISQRPNTNQPPGVPRKLSPREAGYLKETIYFLAAYEHMNDKLFNDYIKDPDDENLSEKDLVPPPFPPDQDPRKVSIAMFGRFRPESISMPFKVEDASQCYLVNFPQGHYPQNNSVLPKLSPWNTDIKALLHGLWSSSGSPNHRDGWRTPPPELRFLEYFMRKFLGVGFRLDLFGGDPKHLHEDYVQWVLSENAIFGENIFSSWYQMQFILEAYHTPTLSYRQIVDYL